MDIAAYIALVDAAITGAQKAFQLLKDAQNGVQHTPEQLNDLGTQIHEQSLVIQQLRASQD